MLLQKSSRSGELGSSTDNLLFFGDPNLGEPGFEIFSRYFPKAKRLIWKKGTDKAPLHREIRAKSWLFTVSFYNDFIFAREDFDFLGLALNVHPALPVLRGVGHDHIPLIEGHADHGGTLHYLSQPLGCKLKRMSEIDSGRIIRIRRRTLSPTATYGDIRILNQQVALEILAELCEQMMRWGCVKTAHRELTHEANTNDLAWANRYVDQSALHSMLEKLKVSTSNHRVFIHQGAM